jgi:hypothetical protein
MKLANRRCLLKVCPFETFVSRNPSYYLNRHYRANFLLGKLIFVEPLQEFSGSLRTAPNLEPDKLCT